MPEYVTAEDCKRLRDGICEQVEYSENRIINRLELHDQQAKQIVKDVDSVKDAQKEFEDKINKITSIVEETSRIQKEAVEERRNMQNQLYENNIWQRRIIFYFIMSALTIVMAFFGIKLSEWVGVLSGV